MKRGFTLMEILVSIAILSLIVSGLCAVLNIGNITYNQDTVLLDLQQQARQAMDGMIREIRQAKEELPARPITIGLDITFYIPGFSNSINYSRNADNQIIRTHPSGTTKVLANNIGTLTFCWRHNGTCNSTRSDSNTIEIELLANKTVRQRPLSFNLTEKVRLRNE